MELSVIVPCLNEEANVPELAARIGDVFEVGNFDGELILVDDGSTDGTWAAIEAASRRAAVRRRAAPRAEPRHRRRLEDRRRRGARAPRLHPRRRPAVPAGGHPAPAARDGGVERRHRAGLALARRARQGAALLLLARAQRHAQRRVRDGPAGQQVRLHPVRARGLRGPALVSRQLLLLAVVHHGGRARQGLLVQAGRDALRARAAPANRSSTTRRSRRWLRSFVDIGQGAVRVSACDRSRRRRCARSSTASGRWCATRRSRRGGACTGAATCSCSARRTG